MEVEFQLQPSDFDEFVRHTYRRVFAVSGWARTLTTINIVVYMLLGFGLVALYHYWTGVQSQEDLAHLKVSIFFISMWVAGLFMYARLYRCIFARGSLEPEGAFLQPKKVTIGPEGVLLKMRGVEASYQWSAIKHLSKSENLLYLWLDNNNALIVPKKAFPSPELFNEFFGQASEHKNANKAN